MANPRICLVIPRKQARKCVFKMYAAKYTPTDEDIWKIYHRNFLGSLVSTVMRQYYDGYIDKVWNLSANGRMSYDIFIYLLRSQCTI